MRGVILINGWVFSHKQRMNKQIQADTYRNKEGWLAQQVFRGRTNTCIGLAVWDEKRTLQGIVQNVSELP